MLSLPADDRIRLLVDGIPSPPVRVVSAPSWSATSVRSRHSSVMYSLTWKRFWPPCGQSQSPLVRTIRQWPHIAVSKGTFPITRPSHAEGSPPYPSPPYLSA